MKSIEDRVIIKNMKVRNRLVLPPLTTNYGTSQGRVTPEILRFYKERSMDMGLVIVEAAAVSQDGRIVPGSLGLWEDGQIQGMAELANVIKQAGARAVIQLNHAGAKRCPQGTNARGLSPSGVACRPGVVPVIMDAKDIDQLVNDFVSAAGRAAEAGFDGVEIHGAHFYLLSQFLSPLTNSREDQYGGDGEKRAALALEIVTQVRERLGQDFPLFFRLNAIENMDGGQTLDQALALGKMLAQAGIDVLDISLAANCSWNTIEDQKILVSTSALAKDQAPGANVEFTSQFKQVCGLPVIAVGKLGSRESAGAAVQNKGVDMVAIGRQMICDPETGKKILAGQDDQVIACEECMKCFASIGKGNPLACKVNKDLPGQGNPIKAES
jgi:2,4-dienoyl-CoA reductase-like NADH-dependent reductase (Old Yellow Enzyme family)